MVRHLPGLLIQQLLVAVRLFLRLECVVDLVLLGQGSGQATEVPDVPSKQNKRFLLLPELRLFHRTPVDRLHASCGIGGGPIPGHLLFLLVTSFLAPHGQHTVQVALVLVELHDTVQGLHILLTESRDGLFGFAVNARLGFLETRAAVGKARCRVGTGCGQGQKESPH
jgi:hypothetical protein